MNNARKALHDLRKGEPDSATRYLVGMARLADPKPGAVPFPDWIRNKFGEVLAAANIGGGALAEIGGSKNSFITKLDGFEVRFLSLYPMDDPSYVEADITNCPQVPDSSFDAVLSINVFEHISKPWLAAKEIERILKPGGVTFHVAPFSYFYHRAPIDCFRYTPDGFLSLFDGMEPLYAEFYTANRRRDNRGKAPRTIDYYGGPDLAIDALGGWRENIYTVFAAKKRLDLVNPE
jgi:SAM-dependent methyltransferase